ncbi:RelA/SpoT domain-containing protein [Rhodococcus kroppenstedtii]|uniref:GTP pyrophosphokinase n=1 Tax=Rhodococcoides kroppenstedtii TaxID=293050 RepID=UPI001C9B1E65|nr:RelA/SpoT domain-containing protein [Rhodococcus kroppenstedtii]MBY6436235.1 RelA/SpoT domain-containing protein [Rhodococcus kroppenstedtii]
MNRTEFSVQPSSENSYAAEKELITFDFDGHGHDAELAYQLVRGNFIDFVATIERILQMALGEAEILIHSIEARAKSLSSFRQKASAVSSSDQNRPRYADPLSEITDLAAARVITFFLSSVAETDGVIREEFEILEKSTKGDTSNFEGRLGYQSVHYLVKLKATRTSLPEYSRFGDMIAELQVRTILQHAWAEIEHEIQYKAADVLPQEVSRRFQALAGLLEIGDREFQALDDANKAITKQARAQIDNGQLVQVEITPDSLKAFLDRKLGPDGRVREWNYSWTARLLRRLGFVDLEQVDRAIANYNDDEVSRALWGTRQGQITRFEDVLLASMGENYIARHSFSDTLSGFAESKQRQLRKLSEKHIQVGNYSPEAEGANEAGPESKD